MFKKVIWGAVAVMVGFFVWMAWPSHISRQAAEDIAIAHVGGGVTNPADRGFAQFQRAWAVEVFYNHLVHEVYISMRTGQVIRMEIDAWD